MKYDLILMDADDTLFDFQKAQAHAIQKLCHLHQLPNPEQTYLLYREINHALWKQLEHGKITQDILRLARFSQLAQHLAIPLDAAQLDQDYSTALGEGSFLIDGALELCRTLSKSCSLYIVTNGLLDIQTRRLSGSVLHPYISRMFVSEQLGCAKPDPAYFDAVFSQIGNPPRERAILLGDSLSSDMRGGRAAGITTCWFAPENAVKNADCDYQISRLGDFLKIVE